MQISDILSSDAEIVSGAIVFRGTRVPVSALFENLAGGTSLEEFLLNFPTVERGQVEGALGLALKALCSDFNDGCIGRD